MWDTIRLLLVSAVAIAFGIGAGSGFRATTELFAMTALGAIGAWMLCWDFTLARRAQRLARRNTHQTWQDLFWLSVLSVASAYLISFGGGIIRRALEHFLLNAGTRVCSWTGVCLAEKMSASPLANIVPDWTDSVWRGPQIGWLIGLCFGLVVLVSQSRSSRSRYLSRSSLQPIVRSLDGLCTGFFAVYGMKAGIEFVERIQLGNIPNYKHALGFALTAFLAALFAGLTATGGGFLRNALFRVAILRIRQWRSLLQFPRSFDPNYAAVIGAAGVGGLVLISEVTTALESYLPAFLQQQDSILNVIAAIAAVISAFFYYPRSR